MTAETLFCTCGRAVRVVRLGRSTLTLGHLQNPKNERHPVTLAPTSKGDPDHHLLPGVGEYGQGRPGTPEGGSRKDYSGVPSQTARRGQEERLPLGAARATTPRRPTPAHGRLPEPSAGKGSR